MGMDQMMQRRAGMAVFGMGVGLGLYALYRLAETDALTGRPLLVVGVFVAVLSNGVLAMVGPLRAVRAALGAFMLGVVVAALAALVSLRYAPGDDTVISAFAALALTVLALVPLPFWVAANGPGWRDYAALFTQAWSIVVRVAAAWAFVGVVWGLIFLSDALLKVVGLTVIGDVLEIGIVPWLITGGVLGLGLAVVQELSEYVSPYLVLRMLRLLLPVVAVVTAVFLLALPVQGVSGLFGGLSVALTLLAMAGAGATLVTTAVDCDDAQATASPVLVWGARGLSLMLPVLAGFAAWAVWLRVEQYGWTPDRLFAAQVAGLGLGYGVLYALAVGRGAGWMARIRAANITMALAVMVLSALTLTPVLNAERISAASQLARYDAGLTPVEMLDPWLLQSWGRAGEQAVAALTERSKQPGQEALAATLSAPGGMEAGVDALAGLEKVLVLQPPGAVATRDIYLKSLADYDAMTILRACRTAMPGGGAGCVMLVADLLPQLPGEEAIIAHRGPDGYITYEGYSMADGVAQQRSLAVTGTLPQFDEGIALIRAWQVTPPALTPAPINQIAVPGGGLFLYP